MRFVFARHFALCLCVLAGLPAASRGAAPSSDALAVPLVPRPQRLERQPGTARLAPDSPIEVVGSTPGEVGIPDLLADLRVVAGGARGAGRLARVLIRPGAAPAVEQPWQAGEAYALTVAPESVVVVAPTVEGRFYAVQTLRQLVRGSSDGRLPAVRVSDWPALRWRGVSDDVSRGQAPARGDFAGLFTRLAYYKLNVYFLYLEDMARFRSAPSVGEDRGAYTPAELRALASAARARHVTVVPILQSVAHQGRLLASDELKGISEFRPPSPALAALGAWGWRVAPALAGALRLPDPDAPGRPLACFALADPATAPRVAELVDEVAASVPSPWFHLGADEPLDLGAGASAAAVLRRGAGAVYAAYVNALAAHVRTALRRTPMIYADELLRDPGAMGALDRNVAVMDWQYAPDAGAASLRRLRAAGFAHVFACAGLWNWFAVYPDWSRALPNVASFSRAARESGADGFVVASWGDGGARSLRSANWPGYAYGAEAAWSGAGDPQEFLGRFASAEYGTREPAVARAIRRVGGQRFEVSGYSQRVFERPADLRERSAPWSDRMRALEADMADARADAARALATARFEREDLAGLDQAAARLQYAAERERTLDSLARRLRGAGWPALEPAERVVWAGRLAALRDTARALNRTYAALWNAHNRPGELPAALAVLETQANAYDRLLARAAAAGRDTASPARTRVATASTRTPVPVTLVRPPAR